MKRLGRKQRKSRMKLEYKLMALFFVCFLIPMLFMNLISANNMDSAVEDNAYKNLRERVGITAASVEQKLAKFDGIGATVAQDHELLEKMTMHSDSYDSGLDYILAQDEIYSYLANLLIKDKYAQSLYIYNVGGDSFCINNSDTVDKSYSPAAEEWYSKVIKSGEKLMLTEHIDMQTVGKRQRVLSYIYPVLRGNGKVSFIIMLNYSAEALAECIADARLEDSEVHITDSDFLCYNDTVPGSDYSRAALGALRRNNGLLRAGSDDTASFIYKEELKGTGWYVVGVTSEVLAKKDIIQYRMWMLVFTGIMTLLMVGISFAVSAVISKPLKSMQELSRKVRNGVPGTEYRITDIKGNRLMRDEYQVFADTINDLLHQVNASMKAQQKQEQAMLQAQINPHFIYNTLNTVKWTAKMEGNLRTEEAVAALINLFKSTLNVNRTFIPISEEIRQIEDYIKVQRRFCDRYAV